MIARPKISRNEWNTTERGAFEVGKFAPFSRPAPDVEAAVDVGRRVVVARRGADVRQGRRLLPGVAGDVVEPDGVLVPAEVVVVAVVLLVAAAEDGDAPVHGRRRVAPAAAVGRRRDLAPGARGDVEGPRVGEARLVLPAPADDDEAARGGRGGVAAPLRRPGRARVARLDLPPGVRRVEGPEVVEVDRLRAPLDVAAEDPELAVDAVARLRERRGSLSLSRARARRCGAGGARTSSARRAARPGAAPRRRESTARRGPTATGARRRRRRPCGPGSAARPWPCPRRARGRRRRRTRRRRPCAGRASPRSGSSRSRSSSAPAAAGPRSPTRSGSGAGTRGQPATSHPCFSLSCGAESRLF